jgi:hypothetical protein
MGRNLQVELAGSPLGPMPTHAWSSSVLTWISTGSKLFLVRSAEECLCIGTRPTDSFSVSGAQAETGLPCEAAVFSSLWQKPGTLKTEGSMNLDDHAVDSIK